MRGKGVGSMVGIFALDPGTTSGLDVGLWRLNCDVSEACADWVGITREVTGSLVSQARELGDLWLEYRERWIEDGHSAFLVVEDYVQGPTRSIVPREGLDPVRVTNMLVGYLVGISAMNEDEGLIPRIERQLPSVAKNYASNERLRNWGAWVVGSDHKRDAKRHALAFRRSLLN